MFYGYSDGTCDVAFGEERDERVGAQRRNSHIQDSGYIDAIDNPE